MRSLAALALFALSAGAGEPGAAPRIVAGAPVCVSGDRPGVPHVEPFLAAHPSDPNLLFGAAVTLPAGRTFLAAVRVTPETSRPPAGQDLAVASRWPFGGDYSGLAAAADGSFRIFWSGSRAGVHQVWTAAAEVAAAQ